MSGCISTIDMMIWKHFSHYCEDNLLVNVPLIQRFDIFYIRLNGLINKQSRFWWFVMPWRSSDLNALLIWLQHICMSSEKLRIWKYASIFITIRLSSWICYITDEISINFTPIWTNIIFFRFHVFVVFCCWWPTGIYIWLFNFVNDGVTLDL